jgi:hypothetical protein
VSDLAKRIRTDISEMLTVMAREEIIISSNNAIICPLGKGKEEITWKANCELSYAFGFQSVLGLYFETLRRRDFTFLFSDGSLAQIYYRVEDERLISHRLCFFPAPILIEPEELELIQELDQILIAEDMIERLRHAVPIRFDFNEEKQADHPHTHATFVSTSCRIPVTAPLSVRRFMGFLGKHLSEPLRKSSIQIGLRDTDVYDETIIEEERYELHFHFRRYRI